MDKHVKGSLFQEYARMVKNLKQVDWGKYLTSSDLEIIHHMIIPSKWYPLESYQRLGVAVFQEIAQGKPEAALAWGRHTMDDLYSTYQQLVMVQGDPVSTLKKFHKLSRQFFDFDGFEIITLEHNYIQIKLSRDFGEIAVQGYTYQILGTIQRLIELCGMKEVKAEFDAKVWEGAPHTIFKLSWAPGHPDTS